MGIPHYFHVLTRTYPNILGSRPPPDCATYCLDYNGVVHQALNKHLEAAAAPAEPAAATPEAAEAALFREIWDYTESCIREVAPTSRVFISMDGVAPVAKMIQQRKRRFLSVFQKRIDGSGHGSAFDRNAISPGTPFMGRLHAYLREQIRNRSGTGLYYAFSSSDEPGEGEHKIFETLAGAGIGAGVGPSAVCIHGLDADLIMLSLLSHIPRIFLMREPVHTSSKSLDPDAPFLYLSIDALRQAILKELRTVYGWPTVGPAEIADPYSPAARAILDDYIAICFLLGNDFLPHIPCIQLKTGGYEQLLAAAKSVYDAGYPAATAGNSIVLPFFARILEELSRSEMDQLVEQIKKYVRFTPRQREGAEPLQPSDFYPLRHKDPLANALLDAAAAAAPAKFRQLYYKHLFHTRANDTGTLRTACTLYVQGIEWTWRYYRRREKDPLWYYPFGYAPLMRDLANYTQSLREPEASGAQQLAVAKFVSPTVQLSCIMPPESAAILPKAVQDLMRRPELGCRHLFPRVYPIQTFLKTHLWECHPVLPVIDIPWITKVAHRSRT